MDLDFWRAMLQHNGAFRHIATYGVAQPVQPDKMLAQVVEDETGRLLFFRFENPKTKDVSFITQAMFLEQYKHQGITEQTIGPLLIKQLQQQGFRRQRFLRVMLRAPGDAPPPEGRTDLRVVEASAPAFQHIYQSVFTDMTPQVAQQHAVNCLESQVYHNYLWTQQDPCAIASVAVADGWAGIYNVGCLPAYRRQGHASALLRAILPAYADKQLFLECQSDPVLAHWYQQFGFATIAQASVWVRPI